MKISSFAILLLAMAFCGYVDKVKERINGIEANSANSSNTGTKSGSSTIDPAKPTSAQQAIIDRGTETGWSDQGVSWRLPAGWKKMDVKKTSFNYESPDNAFLLVNVSELGDNFPMETSLQ